MAVSEQIPAIASPTRLWRLWPAAASIPWFDDELWVSPERISRNDSMVYPMNKFFKSHFVLGYGKSNIHNFFARNIFEICRVQIQEPKHGRHSRPFVPIHKYMSRNYIECVYRRFFPASVG